LALAWRRCIRNVNQFRTLVLKWFIRGLGAPATVKELYPLTVDQIRAGLPGLARSLELDNAGRQVENPASAEVSDQLAKFLHAVNPVQDARFDFHRDDNK
jgi:hypothetical protein